MKDGINGYALPIDASVEDYIKVIEPLINNKEKLKSLKLSSRKRYEKEINWENWGEKFKDIVNRI